MSELGAWVHADGTRFGVWAPKAARVEVELERIGETTIHSLVQVESGVHRGFIDGARAGDRYRYRLDGGESYPDPRSHFQPEGVHGPSEIVDPAAFAWTDGEWPGITMDRLVIYELHVGAYTSAGTFASLTEELPEIARLGVTAIELMPVAEFPGRWNWGYDGVDWFAPSRTYGRPDDLRALVNRAHELGLAVLLDVVYNHLGPDGNYLRAFSEDYFNPDHRTPWGDAINYDGPNNAFTRQLVLDNVHHWIADYHFDGLRLDATDTIIDEGPGHILTDIQMAARAATERAVVVIAEEARNTVRTIQNVERGGFGIDAVWADDFHHQLRVYLTNARENYYADYNGTLGGVATTINEGFYYQGQVTLTGGEPRGTPVSDEPATSFVFCLQNHDQVGNRPFGDRLHHDIHPGRFAAATVLLLLSPEVPLLLMGQEFAASTPFLFFTDHDAELGALVTEGRRNEFGGFRVFQDPSERVNIPDPQAESTFLASKLDLSERDHNAGILALHRDLIALRLTDPVLRIGDRSATQAEELGIHALVLRRSCRGDRRVVIANFGARLDRPVTDLGLEGKWTLLLTTSDARYGGSGQLPEIGDGRIVIPARSAAVFAAE